MSTSSGVAGDSGCRLPLGGGGVAMSISLLAQEACCLLEAQVTFLLKGYFHLSKGISTFPKLPLLVSKHFTLFILLKHINCT